MPTRRQLRSQKREPEKESQDGPKEVQSKKRSRKVFQEKNYDVESLQRKTKKLKLTQRKKSVKQKKKKDTSSEEEQDEDESAFEPSQKSESEDQDDEDDEGTFGDKSNSMESEISIIQKKQKKSKPTTKKSTNVNFDTPEKQIEDINEDEWKEMKIRRAQEVISLNKDGPFFTHPDIIMDDQKRRPDHPDYDPNTLYVPDHEFKNLNPGMKRYWELKSKSFDTIVFYRFGSYFTLYYQDAAKCAPHIELMKPPRLQGSHIGFHQSMKDKNVDILTKKGFKVAIVEQTETTEMMQARIQKSGDKSEIKAVRREIAQIYTRGTHFNMSAEGSLYDYDTKYVLAFYQQGNSFGYCYFDMSTLKFYLGSFDDDFTLKRFRTLTLQTRPMEAICLTSVDKKGETLGILKNSQTPPAMSYISQDSISGQFLEEQLQKIFGENRPKALENLNELSSKALAIAIKFLQQLLLAETSIPVAEFFHQNDQEQTDELLKSGSMVIDAQAIEHLEILEVSGHGNSLLSYLTQHNSTPFGKRMLKRWVVGPLKDAKKIDARLDAVEDFKNNPKLRDTFSKALKKFPDLERMISRIYTYSVRTSVKAIYIDMAALSRLNEFYDLLKILRKVRQLLEETFKKADLKSQRLKELTQSHFPNYEPVLKDFESMINWKTSSGGRKVPEPVSGLDEDFDDANELVDQNKEAIDEYVQSLRDKLKCSETDLSLSTASRRVRFELQVSSKLSSKFESLGDFDKSTGIKGFSRYHSDQLTSLTEKLETSEDSLKHCLIPFIRKMFHKFYENREIFSKAIHCLSELDCLCAMGTQADDSSMTRPKVTEAKKGKKPYMNLVSARHPCIQSSLKKTDDFVPNDCKLGLDSHKPPFLLITGPNMGGKSTYLRQTCIAAILSQIGCYVPAEKCELSIVDRVFTRIGASDRILENKSTFFVELEETKTILDEATADSLVIMDELGRGTSTYDGYSIAHSVVSYLSKKGCRTLFTTHYHMLVKDVEEKVKSGKIALYHMKSEYDEKRNHLEFLYKFEPGVAPQSFGIFVAKMAGIQESVLKKAKIVADKFENKLNKK